MTKHASLNSHPPHSQVFTFFPETAADEWRQPFRQGGQEVLDLLHNEWLQDRVVFVMVDVSLSHLPEAQPSVPPTDPFVGRTIDKYVLEHRIGRGGMGSVYRAHHTMFDKCVAIKLLSSDLVADPMTFERFRREAEASARLKHINVVGVTDFGRTADGMAYLVMEYVDGQSLRHILDREKALKPAQVVALMKQICAAVHAAHRKGIVHRDLKPDNVMVEISDGEEIVKVLDFGIAKLKDLTTGHSLQSEAGSLIGTPQYMSPEQCDGSSLDVRSDIYSLGVMAYEMLAGRVPFTGKPAAVMVQHVTKEPTHLCLMAPHLPLAMGDCIMRTLTKDPTLRQSSAAELAIELEASFSTIKSSESAGRPVTPSPVLQVSPYNPYATRVDGSEEDASLPDTLPLPKIPLATDGPQPMVGSSPQPVKPPAPPEEISMPVEASLPESARVEPRPLPKKEPRRESAKLRAVPAAVSRDFGGTVRRCLRYSPWFAFGWFVLYVLMMFALHHATQSTLETEFAAVLRDRQTNITTLRAQLKTLIERHHLTVSERSLHIKADPPNQQVTISVDYVCPLLTVPMRYHVEQTAQNYSLPIEDVAQVPPTELEVVNISPAELDNYRFEKLQRTEREGQTVK